MGAPGLVRAGFQLGGDRRGTGALQRLVDGGEQDRRADHRAGAGEGKVRELEQVIGGAVEGHDLLARPDLERGQRQGGEQAGAGLGRLGRGFFGPGIGDALRHPGCGADEIGERNGGDDAQGAERLDQAEGAGEGEQEQDEGRGAEQHGEVARPPRH